MSTKLFADSNRASLREIVEDTDYWGTTPATGKTRARRFTQSAIAVTKGTATSDEIRSDRMVSSVIETSASSGGDISWEFSAGNLDLDLQRVLMGTWTRPMEFDFFRGTFVSITADNVITIAGRDITGYLTTGRRAKLSGFLDPANNRYVEITAVALNGVSTEITVAGNDLVVEAGSVFTTVADANDVIIRENTTIAFGGRNITSVGLFTAPIAAKQLVIGQRIFIEGVGYEKGTVTFVGVEDGDTITVSDGTNSISFEAQADAAVNDIDAFVFAIGADDAETAANFAAAVNGLRPVGDLSAAAVADAGVVTITNLNKVGGSIVTSDATALAVAAFAGGDATFGGLYTVVNMGSDSIVVDRELPTMAAGAKITIKGSMLRNPSRNAEIIAQSMTIETGFNDVGQFFVTDGLRAGGFSMEIASGSIITGTTTTMGAETVRGKVSKLDNEANYTVLEAPSTEIVSATANVGALLVNGEEVSTALQSISITLDGSLREQQAVGSKFPVGIAAGRLNLTGSFNAYFADGTNYDIFINHETASIAWPVIDQDGNTYWFTIPAFKVTADPVAPSGTDTDVMEALEFVAFRDPATGCMIQIDRFSSNFPITAL